MTSIRGQGLLARRGQASKAPTGPFSFNGNHEDPLKLNELRPSKAFAGSKVPVGPETPLGPEAPPRSPQAPPLPVGRDPSATRYSQ